jgi:diguanylate cyclase (GGDEF)-like protein
MRAFSWSRYSPWLAPAVVATVVVLAGARLLALSAHEHAAEQRAAAQIAVLDHADLIEAQLQALLERARREARRAASATEDGARAVPLLSVAPVRQAFWMSDAGTLVRTGDSDPAVSRALASEWLSAGAEVPTAGAVLGPVRYGSQWLIAAEASIAPRSAKMPAPPGALSVVYESLDALLLPARFGRLVSEGYDFELSQLDPKSRLSRVFLSSGRGSLADPVTAAIHLPGAQLSPGDSHGLKLAIRPRSGWYPARDLATGIGLIAVLAWAFFLGTHDLMRSLRRARAALATTLGRLRAANERLAAEIEQHQALQQSLEHARYHDPSTGLLNRRYFMDQLDRALRELRSRRRQRIALALVEIDRFTLINDTLGHTAGDELVLQAARRFEKALGGLECTLARWGSDQLAVLLYGVGPPAAAETITTLLQCARREPFALRKHRVRIGARIGYSCTDSGLQRTEDALREADVALSAARRQHGPAIVEYTPGLGGAAVSLVSLEADLHVALERHEFGLLFQPIVDLRAGRAVGVETLLRWQHPLEGLLGPDRFLAIAEQTGAIVPITRWIIERVCRLAAEWRQRAADAEFYITVNLSAAALRDPGLRDYVGLALARAGTPPGYLKFELTEGGLIDSVSTARELLDGFHAMGIDLMLDDFGTGYSSLSYLQLFPFDYVKVDRPFVNRTGSERANRAITAAILQMAASLGLRSVAEVVETQAAAQALLEMGCNFAQGYYFSAPLEAEDAFQLLRSAVPTMATASRPAVDADVADDNGTVALPYSPTLVLHESPTLAMSLADADDGTIVDDVPEGLTGH